MQEEKNPAMGVSLCSSVFLVGVFISWGKLGCDSCAGGCSVVTALGSAETLLLKELQRVLPLKMLLWGLVCARFWSSGRAGSAWRAGILPPAGAGHCPRLPREWAQPEAARGAQGGIFGCFADRTGLSKVGLSTGRQLESVGRAALLCWASRLCSAPPPAGAGACRVCPLGDSSAFLSLFILSALP